MVFERCAVCGKEAFMRCEEHNKCDDCGLTKKEALEKNIHLVHRDGGLTCDKCWKITVDKRIKDFNGNTEGQDEITCPYCGNIFSDSWEYVNNDGIVLTCDDCDNRFKLNVETSTYFSTDKIGELENE